MRCPEHSDGLVRFHRITNTEMELAFTNENSRVESNDAAELMGLFNRADSSPSTAKSSRVMLYQPFFFFTVSLRWNMGASRSSCVVDRISRTVVGD